MYGILMLSQARQRLNMHSSNMYYINYLESVKVWGIPPSQKPIQIVWRCFHYTWLALKVDSMSNLRVLWELHWTWWTLEAPQYSAIIYFSQYVGTVGLWYSFSPWNPPMSTAVYNCLLAKLTTGKRGDIIERTGLILYLCYSFKL